MQLSDAEYVSYFAKHPAVKMGGWQPWAPARLALEIPRYSPINSIVKVQAPILFISAIEDALCPPALIERAVRHCQPGRCTLAIITAAKSHFSMYDKEAFKDATDRMVDFLLNNTRAMR